MMPVTRPVEYLAPDAIRQVWRRFDHFPMETLSKPWLQAHRGTGQRTVEQMERDRETFGASGNCFDLAFWLLRDFARAGIPAYAVSDDIGSRDAHVAVVAETRSGARFLCDLGDLWLEPMAIDTATAQPVRGFFPGADISLTPTGPSLQVTYHRAGGKFSAQTYDLGPIAEPVLCEAAEVNQRYIAQALVEMRDFDAGAHWEFSEVESGRFGAWRSDHNGLHPEPERSNDARWAQRIAEVTGMRSDHALACLQAYRAARTA